MAKVRQTNVNIDYTVNDAEIQKSAVLLNRASKATDDLRNNLDKTKGSAKSAGTAMGRAGDEGSKSFFNLSNVLKSMAITALAQQFLSFTKQVIAIRGEFQKFEAVLTNTLGSRSAALIALGRINEFAKSTPFGVAELTNNFIKLANRGVEPTIKQMRAIADLSATLGKSFDQVVEAILDVNNPERWKEIGVKAETAGNKVRLSFRDTNIEVDRTVKGVTDAVVALGQLNGVAGSTEAISKTLSGQTSNLADAWQQVFNTLGQGNEGVLFNTISLLSQAVEKANELLKGQGQKYTELTSKTLAAEIEGFETLVTTFGDIDKASDEFSKNTEKRLKDIADRQRELMDTPIDKDSNRWLQIAREKELADLRDLFDIYSLELPKAIDDTIKKLKEKKKVEEEASAGKSSVERLKQEAAESMKIGQQVTDYLSDQSDIELFNTKEMLNAKVEQRKLAADKEKQIAKDSADRQKESAKNSASLQEYFFQLRLKKEQETEDEALEIAEDAADQRMRIQQYLTDSVIQTLSMALTAGSNSAQEELQQLDYKYSEQIKLTGNNERAKKELEVKFDRERQILEQKRAEQEKRKALIQIAIDTAVSAVKLFAQTVPPGILSAVAVAFGAIQAGIVSSKKFAGGVIDLKGPGTKTSDSIPAMLSKGESVMTADETVSSRGIFRAVRAKKLNDQMLKEIVSGRSGGVAFNDTNMITKLESIEKELKNNRPQDIVERGHALFKMKRKADSYKRFIRLNTIGDF